MSKYDYSKSCSNRVYHVRVGQCNGIVNATGSGSAVRMIAESIDPENVLEYSDTDISCRKIPGSSFVINVRLCDDEVLKLRASKIAAVMGEQIISMDRQHFCDDSEASNDQDA